MVFRHYRIQIAVRVLLLTLVLTVFAYCLLNGLYLRGFYAGVTAAVVITELFIYIDHFNNEVKSFIQGILQRDFTANFSQKGKGRTFTELFAHLNKVTRMISVISTEKEIQFRYLEMLVEHLRVGVLSYDQDGHIHFANSALKKLLQTSVLISLRDIDRIDDTLSVGVRELKAGETRLLQLQTAGGLRKLSLHASEFRLDASYFKIVSVQDIRSELDLQEVVAWQKLMRVITHEIMNSISPISSLSSTLVERLRNADQLKEADEESWTTLDKGLEAISVRSAGLHHFTESFRQLSHLPHPKKEKVSIIPILERVQSLFADVPIEIEGHNAEISADATLLEQALINLVRNAAEAVADAPHPRIKILVHAAGESKTEITVSDNGAGMSDEIKEKIFVPFFTTRKKGSGIGLAVTRQIIQQHHGEILVRSSPGTGTEFTMVLPNG